MLKAPVGMNSERRPLHVWYTRMAYSQGRTVSFRECISVKIPVVLGEQATTGTSIQGTFLFKGFHFETCYGAPGRRTAAEAPKWRDLSFSIGYFLRFRVKFSGARRIIWWELYFQWNKHGTWNTGVGVDEFPFGFRLPGGFELRTVSVGIGECTPVRYWTKTCVPFYPSFLRLGPWVFWETTLVKQFTEVLPEDFSPKKRVQLFWSPKILPKSQGRWFMRCFYESKCLADVLFGPLVTMAELEVQNLRLGIVQSFCKHISISSPSPE